MSSMPPKHRRQVYVRRRGRMTRGQERALATLRSAYCVDPSKTEFADCFPAPEHKPKLGMEIGFGMGHATVHLSLIHI